MSERATINIIATDNGIEKMELTGSISMLLSACTSTIAKIMIKEGISETETYKLLDKLVSDICSLKIKCGVNAENISRC